MSSKIEETRVAATPAWSRVVDRASAGSVLSGFIGQGVVLVSGVIVARLLGPENRGYLALLALLPMILSQAGSLGLPLAMTYYISRDQARARAIAKTAAGAALLQVVVLVCVHGAVLAFLVTNDPLRVQVAGLATLAVVPGLLAQQYGLAILQGQQRFFSFNVFRLMPVAAYCAAVVAVALTGFGDLVTITVLWSGSCVFAGIATLAVAAYGLPRPDSASGGPRLRPMLAFGMKGLAGSASPVEMFRLDQGVVGLFLSPASLGIYVVAMAFTNLPRFVAQSIGIVAYPRAAAERDRDAARRATWHFFWVTVAACAAVVGLLEVSVAWLVPFFFGEEFGGAVAVARILLVSALLLSARRVLADGARGIGWPGLGTVAELSSWLALVPALALLVPAFAIEGVALALVISSATSLGVLVVGMAVLEARAVHAEASGSEIANETRSQPTP